MSHKSVTFSTVEDGLGLADTYTPDYIVSHGSHDDLPKLIYAGNDQGDAIAAYRLAINGDGYCDVILAFRGS